jgi:hypothetical protein
VDRPLANAFEAQVERLAVMPRSPIRENQIVAVREVSPDRASNCADLFARKQKDPRWIGVAPRQAAMHASFLAA